MSEIVITQGPKVGGNPQTVKCVATLVSNGEEFDAGIYARFPPPLLLLPPPSPLSSVQCDGSLVVPPPCPTWVTEKKSGPPRDGQGLETGRG